jgi:hypothetical protein
LARVSRIKSSKGDIANSPTVYYYHIFLISNGCANTGSIYPVDAKMITKDNVIVNAVIIVISYQLVSNNSRNKL